MDKEKTITIGGAAGMWGDAMLATQQLLTVPNMNYLMYECLAEITMAILTRAYMKDPSQGYAVDIINTMIPNHLEEISRRGIKVITNGGGVNPEAAAESLGQIALEKGLDLKIAVVSGDNILPKRDEMSALGIKEILSKDPLPEKGVISMNAYLGAFPIADALQAGADIVITGRCVDSALVLGPLIHEFSWGREDFNQLAQGSLAGHLLECGPQSTGGLLTDWQSTESWVNMGFPVAECRADGSFILSKPDHTDGIVNVQSATEQMLYEIGDPKAYILPDVVCDFTTVDITELEAGRVQIRNATGRPPTPFYKACAQQADGFRANFVFMITGHDARKKAERLAANAFDRGRYLFKACGYEDFSHTNAEPLGSEYYFGAQSQQQDSREVVVYLSVHHQQREAVNLFAREITSLGLASAQGFTSGITGRARPTPYIQLLSYLVPKDMVDVVIKVDNEVVQEREIPEDIYQEIGKGSPDSTSEQENNPGMDKGHNGIAVPLLSIAYARSGDKGNYSNIGLVARHKDFLPLIAEQITARKVKYHFKHIGTTLVERFPVQGVNGFNFLLHEALGGGGTASLRFDPQGKGFGQNLLEMTVHVPAAITKYPEFKKV